MTVNMMLNNMDSREIAEWLAYLYLDEYKKKFEQQRMDDDERSKMILNTLFGDKIRR